LGAYTIYSVLAGDGSPKDKVAGVAGALGGLGGGTLGAIAGATLGSVVPIAGTFIGGLLGGGLGFLVGDSVVKGLAQWLLGIPVDAFPDKINNMINGSGGGEASGGAAKIGGGAGGEAGPPTGAPVVEKPPLSDFKTPDYGGAITATSDRGIKRQGQKAAKKIREDVLSGALPYEDARMELENLAMPDDNFVDTEMRWIDRQAGQRGLIPAVTPDAKTAALGSIHTENATLKGQQAAGAGGSNMLNAPSTTTVTNNSGTTMVLGSNTAQGGMKLDKLIE
jgi:hypothetical protein